MEVVGKEEKGRSRVGRSRLRRLVALSHAGSSQNKRRTRSYEVTGISYPGRSAEVLVYGEWALPDRFPHTGQRATRDEILAARVMAFSSARAPTSFSGLWAVGLPSIRLLQAVRCLLLWYLNPRYA